MRRAGWCQRTHIGRRTPRSNRRFTQEKNDFASAQGTLLQKGGGAHTKRTRHPSISMSGASLAPSPHADPTPTWIGVTLDGARDERDERDERVVRARRLLAHGHRGAGSRGTCALVLAHQRGGCGRTGAGLVVRRTGIECALRRRRTACRAYCARALQESTSRVQPSKTSSS